MPIDIHWPVPGRVMYVQTGRVIETDDVLAINRQMLRALEKATPAAPVHLLGNATQLETLDVVVPTGIRASTYLGHPATGCVSLYGLTGMSRVLVKLTVQLSSAFTVYPVTLNTDYTAAAQQIRRVDPTLPLPHDDPFV
ncbi:MAG: hypothetical protein AAFU54_14080 [Chloroflexota bacterium]